MAVEQPIALEFNGIGYAVLMATPTDLDDLARGFALAERLIDEGDDLRSVSVLHLPAGLLVRAILAPHCRDRVFERVRHRFAESSCGLCGVETLEQAIRPLPTVTARTNADEAAIFRALDALRAEQPLNRATGAVHAAALCDAGGTVLRVREDVGRHNALDKLVGSMLADDTDWDGGFALLTSRASFELVEKAVLAGCPMLVTISAPTSLAVERAQEAGLDLVVLARSDALLRLCG